MDFFLPSQYHRPAMFKAFALPCAAFCVCLSLPCFAQDLVPTLQLSPVESAKAKQLSQDLTDAFERNERAKTAWKTFQQTYQAEHPELRFPHFTSDFKFAVALENGPTPFFAQVNVLELTGDEQQKLQALKRELTESADSLNQAQKNYQDFQNQLLADHLATTGEGNTVTLANGSKVKIPDPWSSGLVFSSDFRLAVPRSF